MLLGFLSGCGKSPKPSDLTDFDTSQTGFVDKTFTDADGKTSPYVVFVPHDYDGNKLFPVILFMHGLGDTQRIGGGLGPYIQKHEKTFGCITIFPHALPHEAWLPSTTSGKHALGELELVLKAYKADPKRVYCTGLSWGGFGTWEMAAAYPDKWAAIAPICGAGRPEWADRIKGIPTWVFHGAADPTVSVIGSREMVAALKKAGGSPKYTEYPGVGHNCWDRAYADPEFFPWLMHQQKRK